MSGPISDLGELLRSLEVVVLPGIWQFTTQSIDDPVPEDAIMSFREREGSTIISPAGHDTSASNKWTWVEVSVHSDLNAVGFLAKLAEALSAAGIPCNAIAGYYHDHIFVPVGMGTSAVSALVTLKAE